MKQRWGLPVRLQEADSESRSAWGKPRKEGAHPDFADLRSPGTHILKDRVPLASTYGQPAPDWPVGTELVESLVDVLRNQMNIGEGVLPVLFLSPHRSEGRFQRI